MEIEFIALITVLFILFTLILSAKAVQKIILISIKHTTWISSIPDHGRVEVIGEVDGNAIKSPIRDTPCLVWQIEVKELITRGTGKGGTSTKWETTFKQSSTDAFYINDGTGRLLIRPEGADLVLADDVFLENPDSIIYDKVKDLGVETMNILGLEKSLLIFERVVTPGDEVFITGVIQQSDGQKSLAGRLTQPLLITDQDERAMLSILYRKVAGNIVLSFFVVIFCVLFLIGLASQ